MSRFLQRLLGPSEPERPARPGATPYDSLLPGTLDPYGRRIKLVIGRHRHCAVWITDDDTVGWHYNLLPQRLRPAVAEAQKLSGLARSTLSKHLHPHVAMLLAPALYQALLADERTEPLSFFVVARTFIETRSRERARRNYVLFSCAFAIVLGGSLFGVYLSVPKTMPLLIGILRGLAGGTLGAMISIIQRGRDLQIDPLTSALDLTLQGMLRVFLGAFFGAFLTIASLANIAFGNLQSSPVALLALTIVAGFSERLVPDLMERAAKLP